MSGVAPVIGPESFIQGTVPGERRAALVRARRLEAVLLDAAPDGSPAALVHYFRDQTRPDYPWVRAEVICPDAVGAGRLVETRDAGGRAAGGRGRSWHVWVPVTGGPARAGGVAHFTRPATAGERPWELVGVEAATDTDSAIDAAARGSWEDLERAAGGWAAAAVVRSELVCLPIVGRLLAARTGGDHAFTGAPRRRGGTGWLQALVQRGGSVHHWHRQERRGEHRWVRSSCLRFDPGDGFEPETGSSVKVAQVTGERDTQPSSTGRTLSSSRSRSGVRGTDLGVRIDHEGHSFLLFGDTHWDNPVRATRDAIGLITPEGPLPGLPGVELHGSPLRIRGGRVTSREYDVPLDAFTLDGALFAFFSSDHFAQHQVMGRSVITIAEPNLRVSGRARRRPITFKYAATFSDRYFINVSVQRHGDRLYAWGSGGYRADDLRLAELDLRAPDGADGVRYWTGRSPDGDPTWSAHERDAAPLLPGAFGEISVRWSRAVERYLLLAMTGPEDPLGNAVTLRWARHPWGPWSPRRRLFDWVAGGKEPADAASRFIRASTSGDPVGDAIFPPQSLMAGGAYAPYVFDAERVGSDLRLRYTLSTWNPYQVVLMEHLLPLASLE